MGAPAFAVTSPLAGRRTTPEPSYDVFISYAHADGAAFVAVLVEKLKRAGLTVWLDEERRPAGAPIDETLISALQRSRTAVYVVTPAWIGRPYTRTELEVFAKEERRPYVAIIRIPDPRQSALGSAFLGEEKWLRWPDSADADELFWQLYCGLEQMEPGPRAEWKRKGGDRAQGGGLVAELTAPSEPRSEVFTALIAAVTIPQALACDRDLAWGKVCRFVENPRSEAWLVVGARRSAHELFLRRLRESLRTPNRRVVIVRWSGGTVPVGRNGFLASLAAAMNATTEAQLVAALRAQLTDGNVLILHQPVTEDAFERDDLPLYYGRWLPDLLAKADPDNRPDDRIGAVKAVQAIAWWPDGDSGHSPDTWQRSAQELIARVRDQQDAQRLPIRELLELGPISREDVAKWCEEYLPAGTDCPRFVDRVMDGVRDPAEILERIVRLAGED